MMRICCPSNRLRFVGDEVALVAAESEVIAEDALRLIRVEYEVLPGSSTLRRRCIRERRRCIRKAIWWVAKPWWWSGAAWRRVC